MGIKSSPKIILELNPAVVFLRRLVQLATQPNRGGRWMVIEDDLDSRLLALSNLSARTVSDSDKHLDRTNRTRWQTMNIDQVVQYEIALVYNGALPYL